MKIRPRVIKTEELPAAPGHVGGAPALDAQTIRNRSDFLRVRGTSHGHVAVDAGVDNKAVSARELRVLQASYEKTWGLTRQEADFLIRLEQDHGVEIAMSGTKAEPRITLEHGGAAADRVAQLLAGGSTVSERVREALEASLRSCHPRQLNPLLDCEAIYPTVAKALLQQRGYHIDAEADAGAVYAYRPAGWTRRQDRHGERVRLASTDDIRRELHLGSPQDVETQREQTAAAAIREAQQALAADPKGPNRAAHMAVLEAALSRPDVTVLSRKALAGGVMNAVWLVELSNGVKAVWKPAEEEELEQVRKNLEPDHQGRRETAGYVIDKAMGHLAGAPPTVFRELMGSRGALQAFVGAMDGITAMRSQVEHDQNSRIDLAVLDEVIGNLDRKLGNFLVNVAGVLLPIDHGLILPTKNGSQATRDDIGGVDVNDCFATNAPLRPDHIEGLRSLCAREQQVTRELIELGIAPSAIDAMFDRVARMLETGMTHEDWMNAPARHG